MKRILAFLLSLMMVMSLCACAVTEVHAPTSEPTESSSTETSIPTETTEDITKDAEAILQDLVKNHSADDNFISTILTNVPDAFMLTGFRAACWTYFLEMSDGIEYIVIIDDTDYHITSISYWDPEQSTSGPTIYTDAE